MIVVGKNAVIETLNSNIKVDTIYISKLVDIHHFENILNICNNKNIPVIFLDSEKFKNKFSSKSQGIAAVVQEFIYADFGQMLKANNMFLVLLDGIEDPHNLGAILRVAECAGATGVVIPKNRSVCVNETVIRVSAGAATHIPVARVNNLHDAIDEIKQAGGFVYAADMSGDVLFNTNLEGKIAIVIGSEGKGVSKLSLKKSDGVLKIPMFGKVNSLNASVSAGIILYEIVRQRGGL